MYQKQQKLFRLQMLLRIIAALRQWKGILLVNCKRRRWSQYSHTLHVLLRLLVRILAIADSPNETNRSKILTVQLPNDDIRTALNLIDHPENLGKKIQITGSLEAYFAVPGLKSPTQYTFVENTNPTKVKQ